MHSKTLEKDNKVPPQVACFSFFRDLLNETDIANVRFTMSAKTVS